MIIVLLIIILKSITPFDFVSESPIVSGLFLSTVGLSAGVQSIAYQLQATLRQKKGGEWDLLLAGPVKPLPLACGMSLALILVQGLSAVVLGGAHWAVMTGYGETVPAEVWIAFVVLCLQIASLSVFHLAIGVWFSGTWALVLMVGGYLVGQVSEQLYRNTGEGWHRVWDALYCLIPDLNPLGYLQAGGGPMPGSLVGFVFLYNFLYICFLVALMAILLPVVVGRKKE